MKPGHLVQYLIGSVLKDNPDDLNKVRHYFDNVVKRRKTGGWQDFYEARGDLQ